MRSSVSARIIFNTITATTRELIASYGLEPHMQSMLSGIGDCHESMVDRIARRRREDRKILELSVRSPDMVVRIINLHSIERNKRAIKAAEMLAQCRRFGIDEWRLRLVCPEHYTPQRRH
ncbi:MAG: hypothetical protein ABIA47_01555 [bacterium]